MAPSSEPQQHYQNPPLFIDTLYCSEEQWEEQEQEDVAYDEEQKLIYSQNNNINNNKTNPPPDLLEHDLFWEDEELISLFSKEEKQNLESNPCLNTSARSEAVEWILKVHSYYSFSPLTSVIAVDYFDRFVSRFHFQNEKPWMTQLVSVACLSLAAKVEETQVPLLVDFQVETKYVFEAKTIQRMEILVLSTLQWRMNPVTPLSFLDHITRRLGLKSNLCWEFLSRCECVIVSILSDARYLCYLPSVMAAATMLHVINNVDSYILAQYQNQLLGILSIDKAIVDKCSELIKELTSLQSNGNKSNKRKLGSMPASPNGVIDLSFSSDSSNDSWAVASSVTSSPEPLSKKVKAQDKLALPH